MARVFLVGWGSAADGQLGATRAEIQPSPRLFPSLEPIAAPEAVAAGLWASLIVTHNGSAVFTTSGQSFKESHPLSLIPGTAAPPDESAIPAVASVAVGRDFALLLTSSGSLYSIGSGAYGQLGLGAGTLNVTFPARVRALDGIRIVAVAAAEFHWLALDNMGRVYSCGRNSSGQLGLATAAKVHTPVCVAALWPHPVVAISTGDLHSAVLTASGAILGFGSNRHGQLGQSAFRVQVGSFTPVVVPISPEGDAATKVDHDGDVQMTGSKGLREEEEEEGAKEAEEVTTYVDVACGSSHTVALRSDGKIATWGKGESGQLGTRSTQTLYTPTTLSLPVKFVSVSAGDQHSAALTENGEAYLWGDGSQGQIGDGDINDKLLPICIAPPRINDTHYLSTGAKGVNKNANTDLPLRFIRLICGGFHNLAMVTADPHVAVVSAQQVYASRIPRCSVDKMLQARAGLSRFGCAGVLMRSFVRAQYKAAADLRLDIDGMNKAYTSFQQLFGKEGMRVLGYAAARLRYETQVAFGLLKDDGLALATGSEQYSGDGKQAVRLVTPRSQYVDNDDMFRSSVANSAASGHLLILAFLNPVYMERARAPQLAEFAGILLRCEQEGREAFLRMIGNCAPELVVVRFIRPLQNVLTEELKRHGKVRQNAKHATKALALIYHGVYYATKRKKRRRFFVKREEFYNEMVSERVNLRQDYQRWSESKPDLLSAEAADLPPLPSADEKEGKFSFCEYSFLLSAVAKFKILELESLLTMNKESMRSVLSFGSLPMQITPLGQIANMRLPPEQIAQLRYLVLEVRRDNIVSDAFIKVAEYAQHSPRELHKPLKVIFDGEDGVDEGGVRKEFYQVLLEHVLSADYGMFRYDSETRFHWLQRDSLESETSWTLIGIMFGMAAFNSILLDVQFPPVFYRKLQIGLRNKVARVRAEQNGSMNLEEGGLLEEYEANLEDVLETFPSIGKSIGHLLAYKGDDVEEVFGLDFEVPYEGLFGKVETHELIANGGKTAVTKANRKEFARLYIDFLINKSVEKAFEHFSMGFSLMLSGPFVHRLSADELETLLVGERELDFEALRRVAKYEGYQRDDAVMQHLWQVLGEYDAELKRLFLAFVTGTDRAPIGGLGKLVLIIQRAGGDSNRLPTSHTCFNVLLLPQYATRAKLRDRLTTAIRNSKGFGLR